MGRTVTVVALVAALTAGGALLVTWPLWVAPVAGGYYRAVPGSGGRYYFLTRRAAERYPDMWGGGIDPYLRRGIGPVTFRPGLLLRRHLGKGGGIDG